MFLIFIIAGFITGSYTESSIGRIESYDYTNANYGAYSHGKSDPTESTVSSSLVVNDGGFSPSDARFTALSATSPNHDSISTGYLSAAYPTHSSKYSSPAIQYSATAIEKSYTPTSSSTAAVYSSPKSYSPASYSQASSNHVDSLGYTSGNPSLSGFTGSSSAGLGEYHSGLRGYTTTTATGASGTQNTNRGSSANDYTSGYLTSGGGLSGSAHSSLGGLAASSHIGSNYAGFGNTGSALSAHIDPAHGYAAVSSHIVPATTISHDYSANEGDVNYATTNDAQRYTTSAHSSDSPFKDSGYPSSSPIYGSIKSPYMSSLGSHMTGYSGMPYYVKTIDSSGHPSSHFSRYEMGPGIGYTHKSSPLSHLSSLYGGSPTKIIYVKDNSFAGSSYPLSLSNLKSKFYGLHSHSSPTYVSAPSNVLSGYLSRYGSSGLSSSPY